jgi:hypothetical protein
MAMQGTNQSPGDNITASSSPTNDFADQATEAPLGLIAEFWDFLTHNKKWWLTPIIVMLLAVGAFLILGGTVIAPFIYPTF